MIKKRHLSNNNAVHGDQYYLPFLSILGMPSKQTVASLSLSFVCWHRDSK